MIFNTLYWVYKEYVKKFERKIMTNLFNLQGKVALVTGASSGLGVQFAKALAGQGADVVIAARRVEKLEAVKKEIEAMGVKCHAVKCDVTDTANVIAMVAEAEAVMGKIDILVNNAGVGDTAPATDMPEDMWNRVINTNLNSLFFVARECAKGMIKRGYGKIVNIGSIHSEVVMNNATWPVTAYAAAKGGVKMLTKGLASEWAKHGITVNAIGPAYFESEMTDAIFQSGGLDPVESMYCPMGRAGKPGELDGALIYFASDASSYTSGQLLLVDGGWTTL